MASLVEEGVEEEPVVEDVTGDRDLAAAARDLGPRRNGAPGATNKALHSVIRQEGVFCF